MTVLHVHVPAYDADRYTDECIVGLVGQDRIVVSLAYRHDPTGIAAKGTIVAAGPAADGGLHLTVRLDRVNPNGAYDEMLAVSPAPPEGEHRRRFGMGFIAERATQHAADDAATHTGRTFQAIRVHQLSPELAPPSVRLG